MIEKAIEVKEVVNNERVENRQVETREEVKTERVVLNKNKKIRTYRKKKMNKVNHINVFEFKLFSKYFFKVYDG